MRPSSKCDSASGVRIIGTFDKVVGDRGVTGALCDVDIVVVLRCEVLKV